MSSKSDTGKTHVGLWKKYMFDMNHYKPNISTAPRAGEQINTLQSHLMSHETNENGA